MSDAPCRVLVVEDHDLVATAMTILLESGGHLVRCTPTVAGGLEAVRDWDPDIVMLDLTLPDGSGLDLLERLREEGGEPPVVVALTGHDDPATVERCRAAGCRDVLLKPVPARELLQLVEQWAAAARGDRGGAGGAG